MISPLSSKATARYFYQQLQKYPKEPQVLPALYDFIVKKHNTRGTRPALLFGIAGLRHSLAEDCAFEHSLIRSLQSLGGCHRILTMSELLINKQVQALVAPGSQALKN